MGTVNLITLREDLKRTFSGFETAFLMNKMEEMQCYWELFSYFFDQDAVKLCLRVPYPKIHKDGDEAKYHFCKAINMAKMPLESLKIFNRSISIAPHPKLSINPDGSESMEEMEGPESCVFGRKYKVLCAIYVHRASILLRLDQPHLSIENLELASKCGVVGTEEKIRELKRKYLRKRFSLLGFSPSKSTLRPASQEKVLPVITEPNPSIPNFSNALRVEYSNRKGTHAVATRDIRSGEVLVVEKSYCSRIYPREENAVCPVCYIRYISPVPCPNCQLIMFCSVQCRIRGLADHLRECAINSAIRPLGLFEDEASSLPLKVVVSTPFTELKEKLPILLKESKELPPEQLGFDENGIYNSHDYRAAFHLASAHRRMRSPRSLFKSLISAYVITKVLVDSKTYFVDNFGKPFNPSIEDKKLVGGALMHHMCSYQHGFSLADVKLAAEQPRDRVEFGKDAYGDGLFPAVSLMRHSCIAPTVQYTLGDVSVVRAIYPIKAGEEVTVARGDYLITSLYVRKMQFGSVGIECHCTACEEDWPLFSNFPHEYTFKCLKCNEPLEETEEGPICPICIINYKKGDGSREQKALCKQYSTMLKNFEAAEISFMRLMGRIKNRKPLENRHFRKTCQFAEMIYKHVKQPCLLFFKVRYILHLFHSSEDKQFSLEDNV